MQNTYLLWRQSANADCWLTSYINTFYTKTFQVFSPSLKKFKKYILLRHFALHLASLEMQFLLFLSTLTSDIFLSVFFVYRYFELEHCVELWIETLMLSLSKTIVTLSQSPLWFDNFFHSFFQKSKRIHHDYCL